MISLNSKQMLWVAGGISILLHGVFLVGFRAAPPPERVTALLPPTTVWLPALKGEIAAEEIDPRQIWSPLFFAKPSRIGFSRTLLEEPTQTRLMMPVSRVSELYLHVEGAPHVNEAVGPEGLVFAAKEPRAPSVPAVKAAVVSGRSVPSRIYLEPVLRELLEGGVVLPPSLNQETATPWEVRATVVVGTQGVVQHVMLETPLESVELNREVLKLFYTLRFKSSEKPVDGRIEIYSPGRSLPTEVK